MKRKIISLIVACILISCTCIPIIASEVGSYSLNWANILSITGTLTFEDNTGNYSMVIEGKEGTEMITAQATLFYKNNRGNWVEIPQNWKYSVDSDVLFIDEDFTAVVGRTYKIELETTVYIDGVGETETKTTTKTN